MILETLFEIMDLYPNKIAVEHKNKLYTYQELKEYSLRIANKLKMVGIKKGDVLSIELERGYDYIALMLAIWLRGASFVALEDIYPMERLDFIAKDADVKMRINKEFFVDIANYDMIDELYFPKSCEQSLLIYTSGSTGKPKGVIHTHQSIFDAVDRIASAIGNKDKKRIGQKFLEAVPFSFVAGITIIFFNICYGVTVSVAESNVIRDPALLSNYILDKKINMAYIPPKVLKIFNLLGNSLHTVITGSEKVSDLYRDDFKIFNSYGSSESAGGLTFFVIDKKYENTPIGKSYSKEKIYVLDENNKEVETGEMCLAGNFSIGYLHHEELTKETFIKNPFKEQDGFDKLLRSGDIVRKLPDGNILYLNRKDWMIKINGQRVEPGEIENIIRSIPSVHDAVVKDFTDNSGTTFICAYYVLKDNQTIEEEELKKVLSEKLPAYMVPSFFIKLDKLPVNSNGKLDRSALTAPVIKRNEYVEPKEKIEKDICKAFEQILNIKKVGLNDDFFYLGGDSIKVMQLINNLASLNLNTKIIYDGRTVKGIIDLIKDNKTNKDKKVDTLKLILPLTSSQLGIYLACVQNIDQAIYNNPTLLAFDLKTDAKLLKEAIEKVVLNHPGFFAKILIHNDVPSFMYNEDYTKEEICSFAKMKENEFKKRKPTLLKRFDLEKERLFRFNLIQTEKKLYLFLDIHHLIFDGASMQIFFNDLITAYNGEELHKENKTAFDVAYLEQKEKEEKKKNSEEWYLKVFGEVEEVSIPEGDLKNKDVSFAFEKIPLSVSPKDLKDYCLKNKTTENIVLNAVFGYLLAGYTMHKKASFATVYNGRHDMSTANTISMFVKTLPVLCDTTLANTKQYLNNLKEQLLGSMVNDNYSFIDLCKNTGYSSDILFTYQGQLFEFMKNDYLDVELLPFEYNQTGEKLSIQVYEIKKKLIFNIQYQNNIYSKEYILNFVKRFEIILQKFLKNNDTNNIDMLDEVETNYLIQMSYGGALEFDSYKTFIDLFLDSVKNYPNKIAVRDKNSSYTYQELNLAANKIANYLIKHNKNSEFVAVKINRIKEFIASIIGIQKAGLAYIPIDPTYPIDRIEYMISDSLTKIVLDEKLIEKILKNSYDKEINLASSDKPAYMIYTSGSTGKPKGVVILHHSLTNAIMWRKEAYNINEKSINASHASFSFDASIDDIFPPLSFGGEVDILDEITRKDLNLIYDYFIKNKITGVTMSTQIGMSLINEHPDLKLDYMVMGGEKLLPTKKTNFKIFNGYGPTEFTVCSSYHLVLDNEDNIPIGKAVPNTYSLICDANGKLLPQGMIGELCLAGPQISSGYFNREELNKERFVYCPYLKQKMYKTGDLAFYNKNGELEYVGRIDFQVKLRGFRIELGEIENRAASFKDILLSAAEVKNNLLVLYFTAATTINEKELRSYLASSLTDYMVPSLYMQLDEMPLTPNGKINRKALPEIKKDDKDLIKPQNEIQQKIYDLLVEILHFSDFGINDDFNFIGLTSLSAMQFVSKLSTMFKKTIRMVDLDTYYNIELIAKYLSIEEEKTSYEMQKEYPLTQVQLGILSEALAHPNTTIYNVPTLISLPKNINIDKLIISIKQVLAIHPYLKGTIKGNNDDFKVIRDDDKEIEIKVVEYNDDVNKLVKPFDILNDQLVRIYILKNKQNYQLFIDIHHLIFDGESLDIFLKDLNLFYVGQRKEKEEYSEYELALDEIKALNSNNYQKAKDFYNKLLENRDLDCLLINDHNKDNIGKKEYNLSFKIDKNQLMNKLNNHKLTINSLWIASLGLTIEKYLNRKDAFFTTVYNGRSDTRIQQAIGMFVHTLPIVTESGDDDAVTYIRKVGNLLKNSMTNDLYSFKDIAHDYSLRSDILFVYEGRIAQEFLLGKEKITDIQALSLDELKAPITIMVLENDEGYYLHLEYDGNKFSEWSLKSFVESLFIVFEKLINEEKPNTISLLNKERQLELDHFNNTEKDIEKTDLVSLFRKKASSNPKGLAVIYKDKKLTYQEVDQLTDNVAAYLMDQGIGKGDVVSILLSRNEYMVLSPLSVMKTGAAYQPLDSTYPTERLEFMIKDAGSKMIMAEMNLTCKIPNIKLPIFDVSNIYQLKNKKTKLIHPSFEDLMILLYTSGTTGTPKGVMLKQGNLVNFVNWYHNYYDLKPDSVVAAYAGFGFDACMMDLYPALTNGSCVCIVPEEIRMNMKELETYFEINKVTHSFMTTQVGRLFAEENPQSCLKHLSVGGENLTPLKLPETYLMHNGYGPTECTIFSTIQIVDKDYFRIPIGHALDNYKLYVVDENGHELPTGALGELWISGYGVGKGYLNLDQKTKETFINNPFSNKEGFEKVYRTGDIVRRLDDGTIDFIGRNDGQVKIRGFRIELTEVELIIRSYPNIKDVTVQAFTSDSGSKYLAAYFVSDKKIDINLIKDYIKKEKPSYMVPSSIMQIDAIPLNQNQKVNKKALPKPVLIDENKEYVEPKNDLEKEICKLYQDILGLEKVGANDSFFEIGGTSLDAAKVVVYMMNNNYLVSYKDVFSYPTPRELADFIMNNKPEKAKEENNKEEIKIENENLKYNDVAYVNDIKLERPLGNVLLTGSTGFLGMHLFNELIKQNNKLYVVVRGGALPAIDRLKTISMYYFDSPFDEEISKYVTVIDSDITDSTLANKLKDYQIDTIINSAAIVKHFSSDDSIEKVNVGGVKNLLLIAKQHQARFIQISTLSVAGENVGNKFSDDYRMKENQLYFGQDLSNKYVNSKYKAEVEILKAIDEGLDAKIIRVGNLMSRQKDGEFQINSVTNSFLRSLRSYKALGKFPISMLDHKVDFSPIDETAKAILLFAETNKKFTIFHCFNSHQVEMGDVIDALNLAGIEIKKVSDEEFNLTMKSFMQDPQKNMLVSSLLSYSTSDNLEHKFIQSDQTFSIKALYRLGYHWPITDFKYLIKAFEALITLGFFDRDDM